MSIASPLPYGQCPYGTNTFHHTLLMSSFVHHCWKNWEYFDIYFENPKQHISKRGFPYPVSLQSRYWFDILSYDAYCQPRWPPVLCIALQKVGDLARLVDAQAGRLADQETDLHVCSICDTAWSLICCINFWELCRLANKRFATTFKLQTLITNIIYSMHIIYQYWLTAGSYHSRGWQ